MPVPSTIADLNTVAANNSPVGTDPIGTSLDDYLRAISAILKQVSDAKLSTSALGENVAALLASFTSANLAAALTDEGGTGVALFGTMSVAFTPILSDASSGGNSATPAATRCTYAIVAGRCMGTLEFANITTTGMTAGNQLFIQGMPAAGGASGSQYLCPTAAAATATTAGSLHGRINSGQTYISLFDQTTTGSSILAVSALTSTTADLLVSFNYPI